MGNDQSATDGSVPPSPSAPASPIPARPKRSTKPKAQPSAAAAPPSAVTAATTTKKVAKKPAAKKTVATPAKKKPASRTVPPKVETAIANELIAIRAFLVWEKRAQEGLGGDETSDWIEAERQLRAELEA